jgi:hypothetical protein
VKCNAIAPISAEACPECGHVFERAQREPTPIDGPGELEEIDAEKRARQVALRRALGLCSIKQAALLRRFGLNPDIPYSFARSVIDAIAANGWKVPGELRSDPRLRKPAAEIERCA